MQIASNIRRQSETALSAVALRLDDVGASSKQYEVYSNHAWRVGGRTIGYGNWLFLKYIEPFRRWGPYPELTGNDWDDVVGLLSETNAKLTVGVTATWVESENSLVPFPDRFPEAAAALKRGVDAGVIEIANHGLTHCVVADNAFKPRLFAGNRAQHREFWDWLPDEIHDDHLRRSQDILNGWLGRQVVSFVPPGNVFAPSTIAAAARHGLKYLSCMTEPGRRDGIVVVGDVNVVPFHDRDIALHGIEWLRRLIGKHAAHGFCFVRELGERMEMNAA